MDHQPPPFFKRGPAPFARLSFYAALSLALIFVDSRFQTLELVRQGEVKEVTIRGRTIEGVKEAPGINGALEALGVISLLTAIAALAGANSYSPLPKAEQGGGGIGLRPLLGLAACFLFMAFIVALWV